MDKPLFIILLLFPSHKVREGRRPRNVTNVEYVHPEIGEVMLIVQVLILNCLFVLQYEIKNFRFQIQMVQFSMQTIALCCFGLIK